jgi:hypothetical protein
MNGLMKCNDVTGWRSDWMCRLLISRAVSNCPVTPFCREALERLLLAIYFCIRVLIIQLFIWTRFGLFMMKEAHWHRTYRLENVLLTSYEKRLAVGMMFPSLLSTCHGLARSVQCLDRAYTNGFRFCVKTGTFQFDRAFGPGLESTQPLCEDTERHWKTLEKTLSSRVKQPDYEAIHSCPSGTKITLRGSKPHSVMHLHCVVLNCAKNNFPLFLSFEKLARHKCKQIIIFIITIILVRSCYSSRCVLW